jgi:hypothetical protein
MPGHNPPQVTMHAFTSCDLKYICSETKSIIDCLRRKSLQKTTEIFSSMIILRTFVVAFTFVDIFVNNVRFFLRTIYKAKEESKEMWNLFSRSCTSEMNTISRSIDVYNHLPMHTWPAWVHPICILCCLLSSSKSNSKLKRPHDKKFFYSVLLFEKKIRFHCQAYVAGNDICVLDEILPASKDETSCPNQPFCLLHHSYVVYCPLIIITWNLGLNELTSQRSRQGCASMDFRMSVHKEKQACLLTSREQSRCRDKSWNLQGEAWVGIWPRILNNVFIFRRRFPRALSPFNLLDFKLREGAEKVEEL